MLTVSIVVGNPKPQSRTRVIAEAFLRKLVGNADHRLCVIDLVNFHDTILSGPNDEIDALNSKVAASDLVIFASPTYKATYTGLLKSFLDRYQTNGLRGVVAIPILTGSSMAHSMAPTVNLAPLLVELGAVVPGRGFYFEMDQMDQMDQVVETTVGEYIRNFQDLVEVANAIVLSQQPDERMNVGMNGGS
jgi:FMN reductase